MIQDICFDSIFLSEIFKIHMLCMQVCNILEGQRYSRKLNERQVTSILRMACERPTQRQNSILEVNLITIRSLTLSPFYMHCGIHYLCIERSSYSLLSFQVVSRNNYGNDYCAKEFGIKVTNQLALVDARVLPAPRVNLFVLWAALFIF